jgi:hypothetical protein
MHSRHPLLFAIVPSEDTIAEHSLLQTSLDRVADNCASPE